MDSERDRRAAVEEARAEDAGKRPPRRLTRAEQKARTRALLLDATARTFARKGFAGSSVEEIAESAGYSVGAVYSNFGSKEEMFVELIRARASDQLDRSNLIMGAVDVSVEERMRTLGGLLERATEGDREFALLQVEFWLYAVRNPQTMDTFAEAMREPQDRLVKSMEQGLARINRQGAVDAERLATIVLALFHGMVRQRLLDPETVPFDLLGQAVRWMFAGVAATTPAPERQEDPGGQGGRGDQEHQEHQEHQGDQDDQEGQGETE
ncbi:TetR/AcrR family transcriptional regulator [Streptomyces sp. NPDC050560]|uniref:TetR/AcrR family transcriptional regulator n=1 Tax=Streptomyces sp. NPDC050560 TaxID=3365630 RepID=UPI00379E9178